jgi:5-methylcytosine-specific restriction endonuclease McrA
VAIRGSTGDPALKTYARRVLRDTVRADAIRAGDYACRHPRCMLPGVPIDFTPGAKGPASYTLDEIIPRVHGGSPVDPANVRAAHWRCNAAEGARIKNRGWRTRRGLNQGYSDPAW